MNSIFSRKNPYVAAYFRYKLNHVLFWVFYISFWTAYIKTFEGRPYETAKIIGVTVGYTFFQAPAAYLVMYSFIPKYLYRKRYIMFVLSFITITILASVLVQLGYFVVFPIPVTPDQIIQYEKIFFEKIYPKAFGSTLYLIMMFSIYKILKDRIKQENRNKELEHEKVEAELNFLKAQINPHFLFNAINSIYFLIKKDQQTAGETLIKFSDMLRYQLYECNAEKIPLRKELEYLKNYIELERLRKSAKLLIDVQLNCETENLMIAPFMLMPIIENAFKYVRSDPEKANHIIVSLSAEKKSLTMYVANSIDNLQDQYPAAKAGGIGLSNLKRRLELLYARRHDLQIATAHDYYEVTLKLSLDEDQVYNS